MLVIACIEGRVEGQSNMAKRPVFRDESTPALGPVVKQP